MTSITNPKYKTTTDSFVIEFFKASDIESLSLSVAKKYFVGFTGLNILKGFYYFRNTINCDDQITGEDFIANDNTVTNQLIADTVTSQHITAKQIICDELIIKNIPATPSVIYGYVYSDAMSLPIISSITSLTSFIIPIKKPVNILLLPNSKIIFIPTNLLKPKKLIQNKENSCKMFYVDLTHMDGFDLYFNNVKVVV
jgi:hypothetical protein